MLQRMHHHFWVRRRQSRADQAAASRLATPIQARWARQSNFGDTLTPVVVSHFTGRRVVYSTRPQKLLAVGSIIHHAEPGDVVWGAGLLKDVRLSLPKVEVLATRGPLTARNCGLDARVYGDPAILLPLIYRPHVEIKHKVGVIPHYVDKPAASGGHIIDIEAPWRKVIDSILACERIISSSLHGIIAAESYGIPAQWAVMSDRVYGGHFKFHDYLLGTGREIQPPGELPPIPDLENRQQRLIDALRSRYGNPQQVTAAA